MGSPSFCRRFRVFFLASMVSNVFHDHKGSHGGFRMAGPRHGGLFAPRRPRTGKAPSERKAFAFQCSAARRAEQPPFDLSLRLFCHEVILAARPAPSLQTAPVPKLNSFGRSRSGRDDLARARVPFRISRRDHRASSPEVSMETGQPPGRRRPAAPAPGPGAPGADASSQARLGVPPATGRFSSSNRPFC